jgi:hypothetical protein
MKLPIIINGKAQAGKDTFVAMVRAAAEPLGLHIANLSSVDRVKQAAPLLGWDGVKDRRGRQFLSDLKDLSTKAYGGPMTYMLRALDAMPEDSLVFFHIREPEEIDRFKEITGAIALLIQRPGTEDFDNHADRRAEEYPYDWVVCNDGDLDQLQDAAQLFVSYLGRKEVANGVRP